jgi:hypothetical protein
MARGALSPEAVRPPAPIGGLGASVLTQVTSGSLPGDRERIPPTDDRTFDNVETNGRSRSPRAAREGPNRHRGAPPDCTQSCRPLPSVSFWSLAPGCAVRHFATDNPIAAVSSPGRIPTGGGYQHGYQQIEGDTGSVTAYQTLSLVTPNAQKTSDIQMVGHSLACKWWRKGYVGGRGMVPRGGIEPPTLRFSVACSTN